MKHIVAASLMALTLSGCATSNSLLDGLLGRYHNYDPVEYAHTVVLVRQARQLENSCRDPEQLQSQLQGLDQGLIMMRTHAEGRPYNTRLTQLTDDMHRMVRETASKTDMSEFFCRQRSKNIARAAEIMRTLSGEKPE